jgi:hypothetical protein
VILDGLAEGLAASTSPGIIRALPVLGASQRKVAHVIALEGTHMARFAMCAERIADIAKGAISAPPRGHLSV